MFLKSVFGSQREQRRRLMLNDTAHIFPRLFIISQIRHDGSNSYRLMQLGCLESVANSSVAYSSSSPLTYPAPAGTEFASPYFSANHQYPPLHHQSFHYEFQHSHPAVAPEAYGLNSLHSGQYYQQIHHGEPADFINLHNARSALKSSCLDEQQRRELGCLDAYRRHDLSLMTSHGSQAYGVGMHHPDQRLLPGAGLGLSTSASDDLQVPAASVRSFHRFFSLRLRRVPRMSDPCCVPCAPVAYN